MDNLLKNILPDNRAEEFLSAGKNKSLKTTDLFVRIGEIPTKIAFVYSGLFRYVYVNDKGDELTKGLIAENNFLSSYSAMILKEPARFFIEALENSEILEIKWTSIEELMNKDIFWVRFVLKFVEKAFIIKEKRERDLLLLDAGTRYNNFLKEFPGMNQRITQNIIASYLGIKPETLSRIRRKIIF